MTTPGEYQAVFGLSVQVEGDAMFLPMDGGTVGVLLPAAPAAATVQILRGYDALGPVLEIVTRDRNWVILADPNGLVLAPSELPPDVVVLTRPARVPLPTTSISSVRWIIPPRAQHRWLPTLTTVADAVQKAFSGTADESTTVPAS